MTGLIIKDFLVLRKYAKTLFVMLLFYMAYSVFTESATFFTSMSVMFFAIMTITSFTYDDAAKWDRYARCLPVSKKAIVLSKYLLALIFTGTGAVLSAVFSLAYNYFTGGTDIIEQLAVCYGIFASALFFLCLLLPLIYRFGVEKSRIMMIAVLMIPTILVVAAAKMGVPLPTEAQIRLLFAVSPFFLMFLLYISFTVSFRIYRKKDV